MTATFEEIVGPIQHEMPEFPAEVTAMPEMPELTPGEGGAFGLASLLIGAGLIADLPENVQLATIAGGVILGVAGALTTGKIRKHRNEAAAATAIAEIEAAHVASFATDDDE